MEMKRFTYIIFSENQKEKIGYTIIYLTNNIPNLSKTKLLKLLYILDEISIKKTGIPFLNLNYKVWKFGPVDEEIFIDLSSEITLLKKYLVKENENIKAKVGFQDDEFSDYEIELMDYVVEHYGDKTAKELISYTHRHNSPWYITAKENHVLELLENEIINCTDFYIDMSQLIAHDERKKEIYADYLETH